MNFEQKNQFVEDFRGRIADAPFLILTDYQGSTVAQLDSLRRACEPVGMQFQVVKNTLAIRAVEGTDKDSLVEFFKGPVGVVISGDDPIAAAKTFKAQAKDNSFLQAKAGYFEGDVLDPVGVAAVAELPSKEELQSKLLATLLAGPRQVMSMIQAAPRDLLYLLTNYAAKLEEQE